MAHVKNSSPKKKSKQLLSKETLVARKEKGIKITTEDLTQKIYLNVQYRDKEFAKFYGAKFDWDVKKWYVFRVIPEALKKFAPKPKYVEPDSVEGLCKYCFFSFEEGLPASSSDSKACVHCVKNKQPPTCMKCNKFMVSDCWSGGIDDESIVMIHDCVGSPMMYGGYCSFRK